MHTNMRVYTLTALMTPAVPPGAQAEMEQMRREEAEALERIVDELGKQEREIKSYTRATIFGLLFEGAIAVLLVWWLLDRYNLLV